MKPISKKGQVSNLTPAILSLVFAAVVLVFGIVMSQNIQDTQIGVESQTIANETITAFAGTQNKTLDGNTSCGFGVVDTSTVVIWNSTNKIVAAGNYTAHSNGVIENKTADISFYPWSVSYTYTDGGEACIASNKTVVGLGTFADFWEIIVLAIVITVVIGLLLIVFGGKRGR